MKTKIETINDLKEVLVKKIPNTFIDHLPQDYKQNNLPYTIVSKEEETCVVSGGDECLVIVKTFGIQLVEKNKINSNDNILTEVLKENNIDPGFLYTEQDSTTKNWFAQYEISVTIKKV